MRKLWIVLAVIGGTGIAAAGGGSLYLRTSLPDYGRDAVLSGLDAPVEIWRDSMGVPHVWAEGDADLFRAQGYVHAQDRLWQMEMFRRVAEGRLAEIFGADLVSADKYLRTLGLWKAAGLHEEGLDAESRRLLQAYADGVNAFVDSRSGALPPEFVVLGLEPEPWTVRHTLAIEMIMSWDLAQMAIGLDLHAAAQRIGAEKATVLLPEYPDWGTNILDGIPLPEAPEEAVALLNDMSVSQASNAWVIGGPRTASGKPILANDMHLSIQAPALWYLVALHGGDYDVTGMSIPGAPFVVAGHSRAVAWGFTNSNIDDVDLFVERVDPADSTRYLTPDGSEPFEVVMEQIHVKDVDQPILFPVRYTRHGPVITDVHDGEVLAQRWVARDPSNTFRAIPRMNRANTAAEFIRAIEDFDTPHQNIVFADTAGRFGYVLGGRIAVRGDGRTPPLLPVPGWTGEWDWTGELPFAEHPRVIDPATGYVVTANNRQTAGGMADRISMKWEEPFRADRITEMVRSGRDWTAEAVHRQQMDVRDAHAERYVDRAIAAAEGAGLAESADRLRAWGLEAREDSRGAALYYVWLEELGRNAAQSLYDDEDGGYFPRRSVSLILERRMLPWVDGTDSARAAYDRLAVEAMRAAEPVAAGRTWGELHRARPAHRMGEVRILDRLLKLNIGPAPLRGSSYTVNVAHWSGRDFPADVSSGASQRHVVDMADVDGSGGFIIPTGQSGNPLSRHYKDQFGAWREGGLWRIPLDRSAAEERIVHRATLRPAN